MSGPAAAGVMSDAGDYTIAVADTPDQVRAVQRMCEEPALRSSARRLLDALGVGLYVDGFAPRDRGTLVVANHISWLDIVMTACRPMTQLAKRETASWNDRRDLAAMAQETVSGTPSHPTIYPRRHTGPHGEGHSRLSPDNPRPLHLRSG